MTREEYESKKAELLEKRNAISKVLDDLSNSFHDEELKEAKEKYEGKYVLYYHREVRKIGKAPIIPTEYTIYFIDKVKFVGNGFIEVEGRAYSIVNDTWNCQLTKRNHDDFRDNLRISTWLEPDKFLTKEEFEEIINNLENQFSKLCNEVKLF